MNKLNYPLKVLLIATVVSLLPVTLGVSPLDYKGSSLEAAEDDTKKKKKTYKVTQQKDAKDFADNSALY